MKKITIPDSVRVRLPRPVPLVEWAPEVAPKGGGRDNRAPTANRPVVDSAVIDAAVDLPPADADSGISRRVALKVLATVAVVPAAAACGTDGEPSSGEGSSNGVLDVTQPPSNPLATGSPTDPDLLDAEVPWDMQLTDGEMTTVSALADLIIPADDGSPAASSVGAHVYVNEFVSAPYPGHDEDLILIRGGLAWLNQESGARFDVPFHEASLDQQTEICEEIRYLPDAAPNRKAQARFFDKFRDLISTAFWTTDEGMADLGYLGNVASLEFEGPPPEVLSRLGLQ